MLQEFQFNNTDYVKEEGFLRSLYEQRNHHRLTLIEARENITQLPKIAKAIQSLRTTSRHKPLPQSAQERLSSLEDIHANSATKLQQARRNWLSTNSQINQHIENYVKPTSLALSAEIEARLPREIRDQIYETVLLSVFKARRKTWYVGRPCNEYASQELEERPWDSDDAYPIYRVSCPFFSSAPPSHLWDESFVGPFVRAEMVEAFYRTARIYLVLGFGCPNHLDFNKVLREDMWDTGVIPADHASRIVFMQDHREQLVCASGHCGNSTDMQLNSAIWYGDGHDIEERSWAYRYSLIDMAQKTRRAGYRVRAVFYGQELDLDEEIEDLGEDEIEGEDE